MVEADFITQALSDLGYEWERGEVQVRGFGGAKRQADIRVCMGALSAEIGFIQTPQGYDLVADWSMVRDISRERFTNQVTQRYAYHAARSQLEQQGFNLVSEETQSDGQVRLVLRRVSP
jgi:hypothetical protein